ncbi:MAG: hypothetical protein ABI625_07345 [bacterium]
MGREIVTEKDVQLANTRAQSGGTVAKGGTSAAPKKADEYSDRLMKSIPADVVALYIFLAGLVRTDPTAPGWLLWAIFIFLVPGTWAYLAVVLKVKKKVQLLISTVAFVVWVFSLGSENPFSTLVWYKPIFGAVLLPVYTFVAALVKPESAGG